MGLALDGGGDASCLGGAQGYPACLGVDGEAAPHQPAGPPKRREVREREGRKRRGREKERVMTWHLTCGAYVGSTLIQPPR